MKKIFTFIAAALFAVGANAQTDVVKLNAETYDAAKSDNGTWYFTGTDITITPDGGRAAGPKYFPDDMLTDQPERDICAELIREKEDYAVTRHQSEQALVNAGGRAEPVGPLARAGMWAGLEMETLADRSDAHIAEIVIQGATMGVIEMTKALNRALADTDHPRVIVLNVWRSFVEPMIKGGARIDEFVEFK